MLNKHRSSNRIIRVPMRFGDSVIGGHKKNDSKKIVDMIVNEYCKGGNDETMVHSSSKRYENEYASVNVPDDDNVYDSRMMNNNDVVDDKIDSFELPAVRNIEKTWSLPK
uniref:Uncharacterized protein n=1 Tax=Tanacetum cinerariifolium TaxID=118510 RepID=A0A699L5C5_TANCI|nr:hypothetical protein [Tanacetum cinerariifolium]